MSLFYQCVLSPVGELTLVASSRGLVAVLWENDDPLRVRLSDLAEDPQQRILVQAESELKEYFAGQRRAFSVPLDLRGTSFQRQVWEALLGIPFGETRTYGQLARTLGNPKASRAVGSANRCNPVSIIVPCHRVIGTSGKLTGFAGGLEAKAYLLDFENRDKAFSTAEIRVSRGAARQSY
ncbi:methylated-DNA--[protein]-cysteine S-methyltransferase [Silvibacterium dinghuense]|uniref:Methylated-DNA--protein-cysteine methyltransferase n=1 Tax=Silvibacterium dinghuense TaxID=1560006 RepID=A0A4Q1SHG7_9BACT|nr:methylated-DNA--[protein]-cysteine S-methyltransferase [Silvibacterium dinghuense]RXS96996.1 methylated-DNA--[protein]-cysteine S-methyltransferase [Silvibacterium dinghuense]GGG95334.1 methylated-DNA--protein-cysteine methyltransferase [Silvibacterium dinghuense]